MEQTFNITRGGKEYSVNIGITEDKESKLYLEYLTPENEFNSYTRWSFDSLFVDTDKSDVTGKVNLIKTTWRVNQVSTNSVPMLGNQVIEVMITNVEDIKTFLTMFGMPILMSMANGLVRDIFGFNHFGIFLPDGTIRTLTEFEMNTPPTGDYRSWKTGDELPNSIIEPTEV